MKSRLNWISTLTGAAMLVAACGGIAVIDDTGSGGASTSTVSQTTATDTASSAMMSSSTGINDSFCDEACKTLLDCGGGGVNCIDSCLQRQQGPCGELHQIWLSCSLGETNTMCGFGPGAICGNILADYLNCTGEVAGIAECVIEPDGFCFCEGFISPGVEIVQICDPDFGCECIRGGEVVGFCSEADPICDMFGGCCAGPLFTGGV